MVGNRTRVLRVAWLAALIASPPLVAAAGADGDDTHAIRISDFATHADAGMATEFAVR